MKKDLENFIETEIEPVIEKTIQKFLGVTIKELNKDITDKLKKNPLVEIHVPKGLTLKNAKRIFRKAFIERLLKSHFGDVTAVARICGVDRKTIHRMINELGIDINVCRKALLKPEYVKKEALNYVIEESLKSYDKVLHPEKLSTIYKNVDELSRQILNEYNFSWPTLKEAEKEFEKEYITNELKENNWKLTITAKKLNIRYETLHRKIKILKIFRP
ncbi:hypothetical protein D6777_02120 [Candidatus Woesearchaeota archaeon]|nr:MAG: hypothetical protein D6777_02120 [Candidatus Woesearchaeota archaeon]